MDAGRGSGSVRVGCFSGFLGDRRGAIAELIDSSVDVLVGDYLAELTMLILRKSVERGGPGYATSFVDEIHPHLATLAERRIKVVVNAGGLDPEGCADRVRQLCADAGVSLVVASIGGDDVRPALAAPGVWSPVNIDTGAPLDLAGVDVVTANAYLGAWPIVEALRLGADIVICPRVTDASLVVGPAAWYHRWEPDAWDELAGAVVAGHLVECGAQVTGGNFAFFADHPDLGVPGMPVVDIHADGRSVVTKASGRPGVVDVETATAQLLYETGPRLYHNPDVVTDLASVELQETHGGVLVTGVRGLPPTSTTKVALTYEGGYRNSMMFAVTGLELEAKLAWIRRQVRELVGPEESFDQFRVSIIGPAAVGGSRDESTAIVAVAVRDGDRDKVGRTAFAGRFAELLTSSIPGLYLIQPPADARRYAVQWPCLFPKDAIAATVNTGHGALAVPWGPASDDPPVLADLPRIVASETSGRTAEVAFGTVFGARSGDKAGLANVGVWARTDAAYAWLHQHGGAAELAALLPETGGCRIERSELPRVRAVNFSVYGYLSEGVASNLDLDGQAKGLGEYLRSRPVELPVEIVPRALVRQPDLATSSAGGDR